MRRLNRFTLRHFLLAACVLVLLVAATPVAAQGSGGDGDVTGGDVSVGTSQTTSRDNTSLQDPSLGQATDPSKPSTPRAQTIYTVKRGDTLIRIARMFNTTVAAILAANPSIRSANRIYPGQRLVIPAPSRFTTANIYLIALGDNGRSGKKIGCNDSVIPVRVTFGSTQAPLTAALRNLLALKSQMYGESGLYNALYQSNLRVQRITINSGRATIWLAGAFQLGGVCDSPRVEAQLRETALQFSTVNQVSIFINGRPLEEVLSEK
jgi:LysM repeat protein